MQEFTGSFIGQAIATIILLALGTTLWGSKGLVTKVIGAMFIGVAAIQALSSPAILMVGALVGILYLVYKAVRASKKAAKKRRQCQVCGHPEHGRSRCSWPSCWC